MCLLTSEMKDITSLAAMSSSEDDHPYSDQSNRESSLSGPSQANNSVMATLELLSSPTGASIMDWTERLIELSLSTEDPLPGEDSSLGTETSVTVICPPQFSSSHCTSASSGNISTASTASAPPITSGFVSQHSQSQQWAEMSSGYSSALLTKAPVVTISEISNVCSHPLNIPVSSVLSERNIDMSSNCETVIWNSDDLNISWTATDTSDGNQPRTDESNPTRTGFDFDFSDLSDHQYSTPVRENVTFASTISKQHQSSTTSLDCPPSMTSVDREMNFGIDDIIPNVRVSTSVVNCDLSSLDGTQVNQPNEPSIDYNTSQNRNDLFQNPATPLTSQLHDITSVQQSLQASSVTDTRSVSNSGTHSTSLDLTDVFIDFATVEVSPPATNILSTLTDNQTSPDVYNSSADYSGTVTICQAGYSSASVAEFDLNNIPITGADVWVLPSQSSDPQHSNAILSQTFHDDTLHTKTFRDSKSSTAGSNFESPIYTELTSSTSSQNRVEQVTDLMMQSWSPDLLTFNDEEMMGSESVALTQTVADPPALNTPVNVPKNALYSSEVVTSDASSDLSMSSNSIIRSERSNNMRSSSLSLLTRENTHLSTQIYSTSLPANMGSFVSKGPASQPRSSALSLHISRSAASNISNSLSRSMPSSASKPVPSELSSDALLSPSDVETLLLATITSDPKVVSEMPHTKSSLTRTASNTSDASAADSELSSNFSVASTSYGEVEGTEAAPPAQKIKETLRSRLKAKRRVSTSSGEHKLRRTQISSTSTASELASPSEDRLSMSQPFWQTRNVAEPSTSRGSAHFTSGLNTPQPVDSDEDSDEGSSDKDDVGDEDTLSVKSVGSSKSGDSRTSTKRKRDDSVAEQEEGEGEKKEEDMTDRLAKREKNRLAAQKCRHKKRDKIESLTTQVQRLEDKQGRIKREVDRLEIEREHLEEMLRVHALVCQSMKKSQSKK